MPVARAEGEDIVHLVLPHDFRPANERLDRRAEERERDSARRTIWEVATCLCRRRAGPRRRRCTPGGCVSPLWGCPTTPCRSARWDLDTEAALAAGALRNSCESGQSQNQCTKRPVGGWTHLSAALLGTRRGVPSTISSRLYSVTERVATSPGAAWRCGGRRESARSERGNTLRERESTVSDLRCG